MVPGETIRHVPALTSKFVQLWYVQCWYLYSFAPHSPCPHNLLPFES